MKIRVGGKWKLVVNGIEVTLVPVGSLAGLCTELVSVQFLPIKRFKGVVSRIRRLTARICFKRCDVLGKKTHILRDRRKTEQDRLIIDCEKICMVLVLSLSFSDIISN